MSLPIQLSTPCTLGVQSSTSSSVSSRFAISANSRRSGSGGTSRGLGLAGRAVSSASAAARRSSRDARGLRGRVRSGVRGGGRRRSRSSGRGGDRSRPRRWKRARERGARALRASTQQSMRAIADIVDRRGSGRDARGESARGDRATRGKLRSNPTVTRFSRAHSVGLCASRVSETKPLAGTHCEARPRDGRQRLQARGRRGRAPASAPRAEAGAAPPRPRPRRPRPRPPRRPIPQEGGGAQGRAEGRSPSPTPAKPGPIGNPKDMRLTIPRTTPRRSSASSPPRRAIPPCTRWRRARVRPATDPIAPHRRPTHVSPLSASAARRSPNPHPPDPSCARSPSPLRSRRASTSARPVRAPLRCVPTPPHHPSPRPSDRIFSPPDVPRRHPAKNLPRRPKTSRTHFFFDVSPPSLPELSSFPLRSRDQGHAAASLYPVATDPARAARLTRGSSSPSAPSTPSPPSLPPAPPPRRARLALPPRLGSPRLDAARPRVSLRLIPRRRHPDPRGRRRRRFSRQPHASRPSAGARADAERRASPSAECARTPPARFPSSAARSPLR